MVWIRVDELKRSYEKFGALYPRLVDKDGRDIDGRHRARVDSKWPTYKLDWVDSEVKREIIALTANVTRREISGSEIGGRLGKIATLTGWSPRKIASEVGRKYEWVVKYLPQRFKDKLAVKRGKGARSRTSASPNKADSSENAPNGLFASNVWRNDEARLGYGDGSFHGNTDPLLIKQCFLKYAAEGGTVLDPMAGSGTTIDLCREFNLNIKAYDIKPLRDDIELGDAEKLNLENNSIDFIFAHFPYWKKVIYSDNPNDLSRLSFKGFLEKSEKIIQEVRRVLKPNKFFAVLIGDHRRGGKLIDLTSHLSLIGSKYFILFDKVVWLTEGAKRSSSRIERTRTRWRAMKHGYHLINADTLLVFKKGGR